MRSDRQLRCRYEKYIPAEGAKEARSKSKGAFEDCYIELVDQINILTLVRFCAKTLSFSVSEPDDDSLAQSVEDTVYTPDSYTFQKAEEVANEPNRALKASQNAELR